MRINVYDPKYSTEKIWQRIFVHDREMKGKSTEGHIAVLVGLGGHTLRMPPIVCILGFSALNWGILSERRASRARVAESGSRLPVEYQVVV